MFEEGKYVKQGLDFKVIDIKDIGERHFISYAQNMLKNGQDLIVNCDAHYEMWDSNFDKKQSGHIVLLNDIDDHIATITDPVSYTHLDVYKRQDRNGFQKLERRLRRLARVM